LAGVHPALESGVTDPQASGRRSHGQKCHLFAAYYTRTKSDWSESIKRSI
jgi:hypothetical protein